MSPLFLEGESFQRFKGGVCVSLSYNVSQIPLGEAIGLTSVTSIFMLPLFMMASNDLLSLAPFVAAAQSSLPQQNCIIKVVSK